MASHRTLIFIPLLMLLSPAVMAEPPLLEEQEKNESAFGDLRESADRSYQRLYKSIRRNVGDYETVEADTQDALETVAKKLLESTTPSPGKEVPKTKNALVAPLRTLKEKELIDLSGAFLSQIPDLQYEHVERFLQGVDVPLAAAAIYALGATGGKLSAGKEFKLSGTGLLVDVRGGMTGFARRSDLNLGLGWKLRSGSSIKALGSATNIGHGLTTRYELGTQLEGTRLLLRATVFEQELSNLESAADSGLETFAVIPDKKALAKTERGIAAAANVGSFSVRAQVAQARGDNGSLVARIEAADRWTITNETGLSTYFVGAKTRSVAPGDIHSSAEYSGKAQLVISHLIKPQIGLESGGSVSIGTNCQDKVNLFTKLEDMNRELSVIMDFEHDFTRKNTTVALNLRSAFEPEYEEAQADLKIVSARVREELQEQLRLRVAFGALPREVQNESSPDVLRLKKLISNSQKNLRSFLSRMDKDIRQIKKRGKRVFLGVSEEEFQQARQLSGDRKFDPAEHKLAGIL